MTEDDRDEIERRLVRTVREVSLEHELANARSEVEVQRLYTDKYGDDTPWWCYSIGDYLELPTSENTDDDLTDKVFALIPAEHMSPAARHYVREMVNDLFAGWRKDIENR
jgi:hypothetical protein